MKIDTLRLVGPLETGAVLHGELVRLAKRAQLGIRVPEPKKAGPGVLVYPFDWRLAEVATLYHRTSSRVLWDLYESSQTRLEPLYEEIARDIANDDRQWIWPGAKFSIRARNLVEVEAGAMQIVGAVKNAILDGCAKKKLTVGVDPEEPQVVLAVRQHDRKVTVSVDLTGQARHMRGYREEGGIAPLRENLAAALVMLARYDVRSDVFIDPMAGSGTIAIEAALMAQGQPVFSYADTLARFRRGAPTTSEQPLFADAKPKVLAVELSGRTVKGLRKNVEHADVGKFVRVQNADFRDLSKADVEEAVGKSEKGLILCNPPYGARLEDDDLSGLYGDMGEWCRQFIGYRAAFLVANPMFEASFGWAPRIKKPLPNGNQPATFYLFEIDQAAFGRKQMFTPKAEMAMQQRGKRPAGNPGKKVQSR